jgi:hypothetical protein
MSDPVPVPQRRSPRRAEALQPDKPGQGDEREDPKTDAAVKDGRDRSADKLRQQSQDALKNVNTGYD